MVWLSTCTPRWPCRRLRPPLLRSMRFSLRWLPSMARHENLERILQLRAKKYMWSIHKCDHSRLGHCNTKWALPVLILHSRCLPTFPPDNQSVCHAYTHIGAKLSHQTYKHHPIVCLPLACCSSPPPQRWQVRDHWLGSTRDKVTGVVGKGNLWECGDNQLAVCIPPCEYPRENDTA